MNHPAPSGPRPPFNIPATHLFSQFCKYEKWIADEHTSAIIRILFHYKRMQT